MEAWIGNALHGDRSEHVDFIGKSDLAKPGIQGQLLNTLHGLTNCSWIAARVHVVLDERAHHAHGEAGLCDADGVALGGEGIEIAQPTFEHVERVQQLDRGAAASSALEARALYDHYMPNCLGDWTDPETGGPDPRGPPPLPGAPMDVDLTTVPEPDGDIPRMP